MKGPLNYDLWFILKSCYIVAIAQNVSKSRILLLYFCFECFCRVGFLFFSRFKFLSATDTLTVQGVPKKYLAKEKTKWSAVGSNFPIEMTWERLILLCLSKKWLQNNFQTQGQQNSVNNLFLGHPVLFIDLFKTPKSRRFAKKNN